MKNQQRIIGAYMNDDLCERAGCAYVCTKERTRKVEKRWIGRAGEAIAEEEKKMKMKLKENIINNYAIYIPII